MHSEFGDQYVAVTPEVDDPVTEGRDRTEECIRRYNKGRGIVFLGHSQGTSRLIELLRRQIDKRPDMRKRLVSAILLGGNVTVRAGSDRGGVFANIPACRTSRQTGCVIAFSTFNTTPPDETRYGKGDNRYASLFDQPRGPGLRVLCTNPAALRGGTAPLDFINPAKPFAPGTLISLGLTFLGMPLPQADTTFIEARDAFDGRCTNVNGARVLKVTSRPRTPVPRPSPDATDAEARQSRAPRRQRVSAQRWSARCEGPRTPRRR